MAQFLVRQIGRVDFVLSSMFARSMQTAKIMAPALGCESVIDTSTLDPDGTPEKAWEEIKFIVGDADEVLVITHHPLTDLLLALLCGAKTGSGEETHMRHGAIAHVHDSRLCWLVRPDLIARDEETEQVLEAAIEVARAIESLQKGGQTSEESDPATLDEAKGQYYYEEEEYKRWVLGDGGVSGNCELCVENSEDGWIPIEASFANSDDAPAHQNCTCTVETKMRRVRYSYLDDED
jgi:phosphohistidine phosphatase SixA